MPSTLDDLVALGRNRWTVVLLADLAAHDGARFVELLHRLGLSRDSLTRTLEGAVQSGWIARNPGHGHPLRPEYILTDEGKRLATVAGRIDDAQKKVGIAPNALTRWSLPIIRLVDDGHSRFNDLSRALPGAGPRALSQGLRRLAGNSLIDRDLVDAWPPVSRYRLTHSGLYLAKAA